MATYELHITVNEDRATQFSKDNFKFCFAKASQTSSSEGDNFTVNSEDDNFTTVAVSKPIATDIAIQWTERYQMCGSTQYFGNSVSINASTEILPIEFGQTYTIPADDNGVTVVNDSRAPRNGFGFYTLSPQNFKAVLYQMVNDVLTPVYITPDNAGLPPNSTVRITPVGNVFVFFMRSGQSGTMVDVERTDPFQITMNDPVVRVKYGADGKWIINPA